MLLRESFFAHKQVLRSGKIAKLPFKWDQVIRRKRKAAKLRPKRSKPLSRKRFGLMLKEFEGLQRSLKQYSKVFERKLQKGAEKF
jgi:hypothetical protein